MAERSALTELTQIGVEGLSTPGTAVTATKRLQAIGLKLAPAAMVDRFRPDGQKYETIAALTGEWSTGKIDGRLDYQEIVYLLASIVGNPTISTVDTTGKSWLFKSASAAPDSLRALTVERGSSTRAHRAPGHFVTDLTIDWSRKNGCKVSGSTIGKQLTDAVTLAGGAATIDPARPALAGNVGVKIADTKAGLAGATLLDRALSAQWKLSGRVGPIWTLDPTQASYAAVVETVPTLEAKLKMQADANGMAPLPWLRAGTTKWIRIQATDVALAGAATAYYSFTIDMQVKVAAIPTDFGDEDGVVAVEWTFTGVPDATLGGPFEIVAVNTLAAL